MQLCQRPVIGSYYVQCSKGKLDLESIGSSLGFEGELIWTGLDWRGLDISSGLVNRHLINWV